MDPLNFKRQGQMEMAVHGNVWEWEAPARRSRGPPGPVLLRAHGGGAWVEATRGRGSRTAAPVALEQAARTRENCKLLSHIACRITAIVIY